MVVSSALRHQPWAPCHGVGRSQARVKWSNSPRTPLCPSQERGQDGCFMRRSVCCREAPASWDEVAKPCDSSLTKTKYGARWFYLLDTWREPCLGRGRLLLKSCPPPGILAQLRSARLSAARLSSAPTAAEARAMLSSGFPFCSV